MVRNYVSILMTGLLLACPFLCGAAEVGHVTNRVHAASPFHGAIPTHCPEDADNCICWGAVQSPDVRIPGIDSISAPLPLYGLVGILDHAPARSLTHLTSDGASSGLAGWGDVVTVRAYLQNFRC